MKEKGIKKEKEKRERERERERERKIEKKRDFRLVEERCAVTCNFSSRASCSYHAHGKHPFLGGDMRHMDSFTLSLLTNPEVLTINSNSSGNRQVRLVEVVIKEKKPKEKGT